MCKLKFVPKDSRDPLKPHGKFFGSWLPSARGIPSFSMQCRKVAQHENEKVVASKPSVPENSKLISVANQIGNMHKKADA